MKYLLRIRSLSAFNSQPAWRESLEGVFKLGYVRIKSPGVWSNVKACVPELKVAQRIVAEELRT